MIELSQNVCYPETHRKAFDGLTIDYVYDGDKILKENRSSRSDLNFIYDANGITGFKRSAIVNPYAYMKDSMGNVVGIINHDGKLAVRYEYDAWGRCTIVEDEDISGGTTLGQLNPIRWKSQYYDQESGLYYIDGRYYSPETRQYLSAANPETAMANASTIYGLNLYLLCLTNPVGLMYNWHTIEPNADLTYDEAEFTRWQRFWRSPGGMVVAYMLFVAATVLVMLCPVPTGT